MWQHPFQHALQVFLKPNRDGWVQAGKIYDIYMKAGAPAELCMSRISGRTGREHDPCGLGGRWRSAFCVELVRVCGCATKVVTDLAVDARCPQTKLQSHPADRCVPEVECKYDLRLTTMDFGESEPERRLFRDERVEITSLGQGGSWPDCTGPKALA